MALYTNRQLFSDHWLRERLPARDEWALTSLGLARFALWAWKRCAGPRMGSDAIGGGDDVPVEAATRAVKAGLQALGYATGEWQTSQVELWPDGALRWQGVSVAHDVDTEDDADGVHAGSDGRAGPRGMTRDDRAPGVLAAAVDFLARAALGPSPPTPLSLRGEGEPEMSAEASGGRPLRTPATISQPAPAGLAAVGPPGAVSTAGPPTAGSHPARGAPQAAPAGLAAERPSGAVSTAGSPAKEDDMRTVTKGSQLQNILTCLDLALERPYCAQGDMNQVMGYVEGSATGPHYVGLARLVGLLDEVPVKCWLRPTVAGRATVKAGGGSDLGVLGRFLLAEPAIEALWDALLALPAYQRYLLHQLLDILVTARAHHDAQLAARIEDLAYGLYPALRERVDVTSERLGLSGLAAGVARARLLAHGATLEPLDVAPLRSWAAMQGCGSEKSDFTRTERIALLLARAAQRPLRLDAAWLAPAQVQALILLAAARARRLGCVIGREGAMALAHGVEALVGGGVDLRIERRGSNLVAALAQPVALHVRDEAAIGAMERQARGTPLEPSAALIADALRRQVRSGADDLARGALDLEELGQACLSELREVGEPAAHPAAAESAGSSPSRVTIGPPLPLPSDLPRLGVEYHFLDEAMRVRARREAPGVAVLLTDWLARQEGGAETLLALNPHLALLYLAAADTGAQAELLGRGPAGWTLDGEPLVTELDARLRALGYEVWDERYADHEPALHALGEALVEQGLRSGVLRTGRDAPLDAPDSRWYFKATELLAVASVGRGAR